MNPDLKNALSELKVSLSHALGSELLNIRLFGSQTRGSATPRSDVDVYILIRRQSPRIVSDIAGISLAIDLKYNVVISPLVFDVEEYSENKRLGSPVIESIEVRGEEI